MELLKIETRLDRTIEIEGRERSSGVNPFLVLGLKHTKGQTMQVRASLEIEDVEDIIDALSEWHQNAKLNDEQ